MTSDCFFLQCPHLLFWLNLDGHPALPFWQYQRLCHAGIARSKNFITSACFFLQSSHQLGEIRHKSYSQPSFFTSILQWNSITSDCFPTFSCAVRYQQNKTLHFLFYIFIYVCCELSPNNFCGTSTNLQFPVSAYLNWCEKNASSKTVLTQRISAAPLRKSCFPIVSNRRKSSSSVFHGPPKKRRVYEIIWNADKPHPPDVQMPLLYWKIEGFSPRPLICFPPSVLQDYFSLTVWILKHHTLLLLKGTFNMWKVSSHKWKFFMLELTAVSTRIPHLYASCVLLVLLKQDLFSVHLQFHLQLMWCEESIMLNLLIMLNSSSRPVCANNSSFKKWILLYKKKRKKIS